MVYWDTSAVLSALLQDIHSNEARAWLSRDVVHLVSSLAGAEFHASLARLHREGHLTPLQSTATAQAYEQGPWRRVSLSPDPNLFEPLASKFRLRGADLWHLAMAMTLRSELPELMLLTFDVVLRTAAIEENLA